MSRRTAESNKAIRLAWQREYELVKEGKGTRNWTEEQQRDILDSSKGKAYDENGKAFEGHHMKSAEAYPEYQGDSKNIQFLSRAEHTQAHGGWQSPTNGFYDYTTGVTYDFGEDGFTPCEIIKLSNPVIAIDNLNVNSTAQPKEEQRLSNVDSSIPDSHHPNGISSSVPETEKKSVVNQIPKRAVIDNFKNAANTTKDFFARHPVITFGLRLAVTTIIGKAINQKAKTRSAEHPKHDKQNKPPLKTVAKVGINVISKFDFKKSKSALKQLGYTVATNKNLSETDRHKILHKAINNGLMSKEAICTFLENNINLHKNQSNFTDAVKKWMVDLAYVKDKL